MGRHRKENPAEGLKPPSATSATTARWRRAITVLLAAFGVLTVAGMALLWPPRTPVNVSPEFSHTFALATPRETATVEDVQVASCRTKEAGKVYAIIPAEAQGSTEADCSQALLRIRTGSDADKYTLLMSFGKPGEPTFTPGDTLKLARTQDNTGATVYSFVDYERSHTLLIWALIIVAATVTLAGLRGMRALIGLVIALGVVGVFLIPALLHGGPALPLAVVSGSAILFLVVLLVHGLNWKSYAALAGTLSALIIAAGLAWLAIDSTRLAGYGDDENLQILLYLPDVSVTSLMLCGFIIGSLGVLNDVTISQASTVNELAELEPDATPLRLFRGAMRVGQDHISSMVYTLVLTYTGAALPLLLLISVSGQPLMETLTSDIMATELLRSGVGAIALTLAVPITTLFAAYVVPRGQTVQKAPA